MSSRDADRPSWKCSSQGSGHLTFDLQVRHNGNIVLVICSLTEVVSCVVGLEVSNAQGPVGVGEEAFIL